MASSHLYKIACLARKLDLETDNIEKKYSHGPTTELLHNVHVYEDKSLLPGIVTLMVELHVDFLDMKERQRLYPCWGGNYSVRAVTTKNLLEELGQDESAFHQNDERENQWHEKGKVRLSHSLKSRGAACTVL